MCRHNSSVCKSVNKTIVLSLLLSIYVTCTRGELGLIKCEVDYFEVL